MLDIGSRFALVTPWTAIVVGGSGGDAYGPRRLAMAIVACSFRPPARPGSQRCHRGAGGGVVDEQPARHEPERSVSARPARARGPARLCYERRAAGHPELAGRVTLRVKIAVDGVPREAKVISSTLRAAMSIPASSAPYLA